MLNEEGLRLIGAHEVTVVDGEPFAALVSLQKHGSIRTRCSNEGSHWAVLPAIQVCLPALVGPKVPLVFQAE